MSTDSLLRLRLPTDASASTARARQSASTLLARAALTALVAWLLIEGGDIARAIVDRREDGWIACATAAAIVVSAVVSSIAGFAFCALAGTALAYLHIEPVRAVQMMVVCSIVTQCYAVWTIRTAIRWRALLPLLAAGTATVPLGAWLLLHSERMVYSAGLGAFLVGYGAYVALRRDGCVVRGSAWHDAAAGALGGLAGGLGGLPGSFVTIWCSLRGWDKLRQRAVYQPYILAMQLVTIVCLHWLAQGGPGIGHDVAWVPFALLGAICGLAIFRRLDKKQFQLAVSVLLVVCGLGLLARVL
jgi:uncharacterized membrane protein YfcA